MAATISPGCRSVTDQIVREANAAPAIQNAFTAFRASTSRSFR